MDFTMIDRLAVEYGCEVAEQEPMKKHTSFKVGGPADRFVTAGNKEQLSAALKAVREAALPLFILGNGSNLLVSDQGIRGVVLTLSGEFRKIELLEDCESIVCGSAAANSSLCRFARENSLTGLEFAWGIPGTVGGGVYMNAGAYGGEMKDVVRKVNHMDLSGAVGTYLHDELDFAYRKSAYTDSDRIITDVLFKLKKGVQEDITAKMDDLMNRRREKQPYEMPSAGSTFKRPEGAFAAALIEECGLKGRAVGGARVSEKHAGFVVNTGNATCDDILKLINIIKQTVYEKKGFRLECEVKFIGG